MDLADTVELPIQRRADRALPGEGVAARGGGDPDDQRWIRRHRTALQAASGLTLAAAFAGGALWYVPRVVDADRALLTGTVTSSAIVGLNFAGPGEIAAMKVHPGQAVRKGQVLADEYAPDPHPAIFADKAAIAADLARISGIRSAERASPSLADSGQLAVGRARLAADRARLATDQAAARATEIVAPAAGVIVAANGQVGQAVTSSGIRNYAADVQQAPVSQPPQFSLLPEGPQASYKAPPNAALPVIALRTSADWQVTALVPEDSVRRVRPGRKVTVSVPSARISALPGRIGEVLPAPESTPQGTSYQVVVTVTRQAAITPLNGMAADIRLGP